VISTNRHTIRTKHGVVAVYTCRHLPPCKLSHPNSTACACPKWLYIHPAGGERKRVAARTGSFAEACERAQEVLNSFDPNLRELAQRRAAEVQSAQPIESVLESYYRDLRFGLARSQTYVANVKSLLGARVESGLIFGNLLKFLERTNLSRPLEKKIRNMDQLDANLLKEWRATWGYNDLTAAQRWGMVRNFFFWAINNGVIRVNPAQNMKAGSVKKGNRCGHFTEQQYIAILQAVPKYLPDNMPALTRTNLLTRLTTIIELMRGSGMALVDAVLYRPDKIRDGVLRYRRHKNGQLAIVPLEKRLLEMLAHVPPEVDSLGDEQPFGFRSTDLQSTCATWRRRFHSVCQLAGITVVQTEIGKTLPPHPHMLRDSFAIWHLTNGTRIDTVSKMLGHANTTITENAYLPWCKERQDAVIADARATLERIAVSPTGDKGPPRKRRVRAPAASTGPASPLLQ
jgi:integrase